MKFIWKLTFADQSVALDWKQLYYELKFIVNVIVDDTINEQTKEKINNNGNNYCYHLCYKYDNINNYNTFQ